MYRIIFVCNFDLFSLTTADPGDMTEKLITYLLVLYKRRRKHIVLILNAVYAADVVDVISCNIGVRLLKR